MVKEQVVRNFSDANVLISKGYKLRRIDRNINDKSKLVFLFEYVDGIKEELNSISKKYK